MRKILVTGKNSYIGKCFINFMNKHNINYYVESISVRDENWKKKSFEDFDIIIHLAAIVHQSEKDVSYDDYEKVNHQLPVELAKKAKEEGVKHFVFLSTMSVYGINTGHITAKTPINPNSFYARSKALAEESLQQLTTSDFRVAIIRPPMVYGASSKGNYNALRRFALSSPVFPKVNNQRSAIFVDNLCEFLKLAIDNNLQGVFFPQNDKYMNTSETVKLIAKAHSKNIIISRVLGLGIKPLMFSSIVQKAFGSLTYDASLPGGPKTMDYNIVSTEDSVNLIESKWNLTK